MGEQFGVGMLDDKGAGRRPGQHQRDRGQIGPQRELARAVIAPAGQRRAAGRLRLVGAQHHRWRQSGKEQRGHGDQPAAPGNGIDKPGQRRCCRECSIGQQDHR